MTMPKVDPVFGKQADLFGFPRFDSAAFTAALSAQVKGSVLSRDQIADACRAFLGRRVTASMVNDWCSPAKPHEPRLSEVVALTAVTRRTDLVDAVARVAGSRVITPAEAEMLELVELEEARGDIDRRIQALRTMRAHRQARDGRDDRAANDSARVLR